MRLEIHYLINCSCHYESPGFIGIAGSAAQVAQPFTKWNSGARQLEPVQLPPNSGGIVANFWLALVNSQLVQNRFCRIKKLWELCEAFSQPNQLAPRSPAGM